MKSRLTVWDVLAVVAIGGALALPALALERSVVRRLRLVACESNQRALFTAMGRHHCSGCCKRPAETYCLGDGSGIWRALMEENCVENAAQLRCPVRDAPAAGDTDYQGPAYDLCDGVGASRFLVCDRADNHPDGMPMCATTRAGDTVRFERGSYGYGRAMKETKP